MKNTINLMILIGAVTVTVISAQQSTEHPTTVSVQGVLRDNDGRSLADQNYNMTFEIYGNENGTGTALWDEEVILNVVNGVWSHTLGLDPSNLLTGLDSDGTNYLKITVGTDVLSPLTLLNLNPYETLNVTSGGNKIPATGNVGIGTTNPSFKLDMRGDDENARLGRAEIGGWPANTGYAYFGNRNLNHATAGNYALLQSTTGTTYLNAANGKNIHFRINNSDKMMLKSNGNFGIGTTSPSEKLHVVGNIDLNGSLRMTPGSSSTKIADTFAGNTVKSRIDFAAGTGSTDPGAIIHETRSAENNEGVLHLMPSDDNQYGDYVSIHGTNDPDKIKLHTSGKIEGVTDMDMSGDLVVGGEITASNITVKQQVFRITTGNHYINTSGWTNMNNGSNISGTAIINGSFCYALQTDGMWTDGSAHRIYLRLKFTGSNGTFYKPDNNGHKKLYYIHDSRLDAWTNTLCVDDLPAGTYTVQLQWRGENSHNTRWDSTYGYLGLSIW